MLWHSLEDKRSPPQIALIHVALVASQLVDGAVNMIEEKGGGEALHDTRQAFGFWVEGLPPFNELIPTYVWYLWEPKEERRSHCLPRSVALEIIGTTNKQ